MIVTITVNPSVDRTIEVDQLRRGEVLRATAARVDPGGKGINVSRALVAHGVRTRAVVAVGGAEGHQLTSLLGLAGVELVPVPIAGSTRSNVTVVEPDGTTTKLNEPGATLSPAEIARLLEAVVAAAADADWLVVSGSLPPRVPVGVYGDLVRLARAAGRRCAVDTSGPALAAALAAGPGLVKPNREELEEFAGRPVGTLGDVVEAARDLLAAGAGQVLASLGADGAVLVRPDGVLHARGPAVVPLSSVGAGDALLAGFLAAGADGAPALCAALAWGAAAVALPGSRMPTPADLRPALVQLEPRPDLDRPLSGLTHAPA